jgi:hypothetical protein
MRVQVQAPPIAYRPLPMTFRSKGFDYKQTQRVGDVAMFEQTKPTLSRTWYEIVLVQRHQGYQIGGVDVLPAETMPSTSQWGRLGFTYRDPKEAQRRFDELVRKSS